ncbi:MAG: nucleotidyltransferase domain-containing protein [Candidatus Saccharimonadales bacterium]
MQSNDVIKLVKLFEKNDITVWVDGGWCVDALLGAITRSHSDLDIAVHHQNNTKLCELLGSIGYKQELRKDSSEWMYVMVDGLGKKVDVHVFEYDKDGKNIYGIEYPFGSLTGTGIIDGQEVKCINPEWMFKFKTAYQVKEKDLQDVQALSKKFGFALPSSYQID